MFLVILAIAAVVNIFSSHLLADHQQRLGVVARRGRRGRHRHPVPGPGPPRQFLATCSPRRSTTAALFDGETSGAGWLFFVLPISAILTQYTITGYDASAHLSEETKSAAGAAAKGIWRSIFYSAIGGWILLLAFLFAVQDPDAVSANGGGVYTIFTQSMSSGWVGIVLLISTAGQFFCAMACMTSSSRMLFAFSRDRAVPGWKLWSTLSKNRVPANGVILSAVIAALITLPALVTVLIRSTARRADAGAFFAVVSIGVVGLYLAFRHPDLPALAAGRSVQGRILEPREELQVDGPVALVEIAITSFVALFPTSPGGVPWNPEFEWKFVNYTPLLVGGVLILLWIFWHLSVKKWFTGPISQVDTAETVR